MVPALDATAFDVLAEDLDPYVAFDFMATFIALLDSRIERIQQALRGSDGEEITTALLSLHASAVIAGAAQLRASATHALNEQPMEPGTSETFVRYLREQADTFRAAFRNLPNPSMPTAHKTPGPERQGNSDEGEHILERPRTQVLD